MLLCCAFVLGLYIEIFYVAPYCSCKFVFIVCLLFYCKGPLVFSVHVRFSLFSLSHFCVCVFVLTCVCVCCACVCLCACVFEFQSDIEFLSTICIFDFFIC